jgi:hypothetical protein
MNAIKSILLAGALISGASSLGFAQSASTLGAGSNSGTSNEWLRN